MQWLLNKFWLIVDSLLSFRYRTADYVRGTVQSASELGAELERRLESPTYTTVRSFAGIEGRKRFVPWIKTVITTDEYKYLIFSLRENLIESMIGVDDPSKIIRLSARIEMLAVIDRYLHEEVRSYEAQVQRDQEI